MYGMLRDLGWKRNGDLKYLINVMIKVKELLINYHKKIVLVLLINHIIELYLLNSIIKTY
jgi:predicted thioredoxin/glutaredoxin